MSKACLSLKALQAQSRVWPEIISRAPATSAVHQHHNAHSLTGSRHDGHGERQNCTQRSYGTKAARDGREWQTYNFMLFPSLEIAIKADLIKPVCIIEVCRETLTGSRHSLSVRTRSTGLFGIPSSHDRDFSWGCKPDVSPPVCSDAARMLIRNNIAYTRAWHPHLKQSCILSLSSSALVCLITDLAQEVCVLHYIFRRCISKFCHAGILCRGPAQLIVFSYVTSGKPVLCFLTSVHWIFVVCFFSQSQCYQSIHMSNKTVGVT